MTTPRQTAFISGHTQITEEEFEAHYRGKLDEAIRQGHRFVAGDAPGVDTGAVRYLLMRGVPPQDITVYTYRKTDPVQELAKVGITQVTIMPGPWSSYTQRDAQMTEDSDYDIAWVRSVEESRIMYGAKFDPKRKSGTERNLVRRAKKQAPPTGTTTPNP